MPTLLSRLARAAGYRAAVAAFPPEAKTSAAAPLIALQYQRQPVWSPRDYGAFAREGFMQNPVVYRCVRMIAEAAASVPIDLYAGDQLILQHPLLDLLAQPNPLQCRPDLLESWYSYLLVSGNAYMEAVAPGGALRELYVLRPDRLSIVPGADGWPASYDYTVAGHKVSYSDDALPGVRPILHQALFHPANDYYGLSPIEAAATAIDIHNAASAWNKAMLDNSALPSGALVYTAADRQLTADQYARLKSELESTFQGAKNAGRPMLLEGGLDWRAMSLSPKDMDFTESKRQAARDIALALGVPPMLLGIPGDNTHANYQEANRAFWRHTILPLTGRTLKAISGWLGPAYGGGLELRVDLDGIEALSAERDQLWTRVGAASFLTDDEKRAAVGYGADETPAQDGAETKFDPAQPRVPAGGSGGGQWAGGGAGSIIPGTDLLHLVATQGSSGYPVDLMEEERLGGHTIDRHVAKPPAYLKARILGNRINIPLIGAVGEKRAGSFPSVEAASKLINATIAANRDKIDAFVAGGLLHALPYQNLFLKFRSRTGYEAYVADDQSQPVMRDTYSVMVSLRRSQSSKKGYFVVSAYPLNED